MAQGENDAAAASADAAAAISDGNSTGPSRLGFDDAELARRIAQGDRIAEIMLVRRFTRPIGAILRRHVADRDSIADLVQDTFEAVLTALRSGALRANDRLLAFMLQTARNLGANANRKGARRQTTCDLNAIALAVDESLSPFDVLLRNELRQTVLRLMEKLVVPRDRQLLVRYYREGQERNALQAEFGLTPDQFDRVLSRARRRLRLLATAAQLDAE